MANLGGWEIVIILVVLVLLFGAKRLPDMARSLGQSARVLKGEVKGLKNDEHRDDEPVRGGRPASSTKSGEPAPQVHTERITERRTETPGAAGQ